MVFAFFTHKQNYAREHFTGGIRAIGKFLYIVSLIGLIAEIAFLIYLSYTMSIINTILLLLETYLFMWVFSGIIGKIVMRQTKKICDENEPYFSSLYDHNYDVAVTITAEIGVIVNIIIAIIFILNFI